MIKFIIVEDDEKCISKIKRIIDKEKYRTDKEIRTCEFTGFNKNLQTIIEDDNERKVYILDIELKNSKSGIEIASMIRENDWESEIIFITNHDKMFETAHRNVYEVFDFIEKYHKLDERLTKDIKQIISKKFDKKMFSYKGRNVDLELYLHSIEYIYRDKEDRKVIIVTDISSFSINMGVKEIYEKLDERFKIVHRSCIVNTDKVSTYNWSDSSILMKNGTIVPYLSKKYRKDIEK